MAVGPKPLAVADRDSEPLVDRERLDHHTGRRHIPLLHDLGETVGLERHE